MANSPELKAKLAKRNSFSKWFGRRWSFLKGHRNEDMIAAFIVMVLLALASLPVYPFPAIFTKNTPTTFIFGVNDNVNVTAFKTLSNGTQISRNETVNIPLANGTMTLDAKGGISVDNPATMHIHLFLIEAILGNLQYEMDFSTASIEIEGAYAYPITESQLGFPALANISLNLSQNRTEYTGTQTVQFFESGVLNTTMFFSNAQIFLTTGKMITPLYPQISIVSPKVIQVSPADETVASDNGAYTIALTWVIIGLSFLSLRKEH